MQSSLETDLSLSCFGCISILEWHDIDETTSDEHLAKFPRIYSCFFLVSRKEEERLKLRNERGLYPSRSCPTAFSSDQSVSDSVVFSCLSMNNDRLKEMLPLLLNYVCSCHASTWDMTQQRPRVVTENLREKKVDVWRDDYEKISRRLRCPETKRNLCHCRIWPFIPDSDPSLVGVLFNMFNLNASRQTEVKTNDCIKIELNKERACKTWWRSWWSTKRQEMKVKFSRQTSLYYVSSPQSRRVFSI